MVADDRAASKDCSTCSRCPIQECPLDAEVSGRLLSGWRLGIAAIGLFLAPIALAIAGAALFDQSGGAQFLGAIGGLILGVAASTLVVRFMYSRNRESRQSQ